MPNSLLITLPSFLLGLAHAFEADHLTAVGAFVAQSPSKKASFFFGAKWAFGHALSLFIAGSLLYILKVSFIDLASLNAEHLVGYSLIALGCWVLLKIFFLGDSEIKERSHGSFVMGLLHGVAGSAAFLGESVFALLGSYIQVLSFTFIFSLGVLFGIASYSTIVGQLFCWSLKYSQRLTQIIKAVVAVWTITIGCKWAFF